MEHRKMSAIQKNRILRNRRKTFDPLSLFQGTTYSGHWFDFSDASMLFQDSSGTIPVQTDGDPIGYAASKRTSGGGVTQRPGSDSYRPLYKIVNGIGCAQFDGVGTGLVANSTLLSALYCKGAEDTAMVRIIVLADPLTFLATTYSYGRWVGASNAGSAMQRRGSTSDARTWLYNVSNDEVVSDWTSPLVFTHVAKNIGTPGQYTRINGVDIPSAVGEFASNSGVGNSTDCSIGYSTATGQYAKSNIYQDFYLFYLPDSETLLNLERFLGAKAGVFF